MERETVQENMKELEQKHDDEVSALRSDLERERAQFEKALHDEKEQLKSLQAALDNDESKIIFKRFTLVVSF